MKQLLFKLAMSALAIFTVVPATAQSADACRKTESVCVEGPETRNIAGAQIHKACWRYSHKFDCVQESMLDTCAPLKTAPGCVQTGSVCKTRAFNNECLVFTNAFTCDAKQYPLPEGVVQVGESYTITKDEIAGEQCQALKQNPQCQKTTSVCVDPGGTRMVNGKAVTKDCWGWEETYACVSMQSDCQDFSQNNACKLVAQTCESRNPDGTCALKALTYSCTTGSTGPTEVTTCNGGKFCLNGMCFDQPAGNDRDFAMAMTMMEAGRQAAGYAEGSDFVKFFSGDAQDCSKTAFANCCRTNTKGANKSNGAMISTVMQAGKQAWGSWYVYDALHQTTRSTNALGAIYTKFAATDGSWANFATGEFVSGFNYYGVSFNPMAAGGQFFSFDPTSFAIAVAFQLLAELMSCEQEEEVLAMQRGQNLCTYVGSYCTQKFLGSCVSRKSSYCCFNSRLARMIQEQGRSQLGLSWGEAEAPQCQGLTEEQFKQIDFSKMDLSEFVDDIANNVQLPDTTNLQTKNQELINQKIQNYFAK
jgi:conjugal transfer mating pair stabilization protein TraN